MDSQQSLHRDDEGRPLAILEVNGDITERKRAAALAERFFALTLDLLVTLDTEGYFRTVNPACTRVLGWSEEELTGRPFIEFVHPNDHAASLAVAQRLLTKGGEVAAFENRYRCSDGSYRWLSWNAIADPLDGVLLAAAQDITDRKRAISAQLTRAQRAVRLQHVTASLAEALTVEEVNEVVVGDGVAAAGAVAGSIAILTPDGHSVRVGSMKGYSEAVQQAWSEIPLDLPTPLTDAARTSEPVYLRSLAEFLARYPELSGAVETSRHRSWAAVPLVSSGRTLGALGFSWATELALSEEERVFLLTVAAPCAQALERARLYEREHATAVGLQRSLLPQRLPELAAASVAARYQPGGTDSEVGGDWYDVMRLPNGHVGICVGDVEGHNVRAAALMGRVRSALRAYAIEGHSPAVVMERTNTFLFSLDVEQLVTCCYLELDLDEGTAAVVTAGHPPPLLVPPVGPANYVDVEPGLPLGVLEGAAPPDSTVILAAGTTLVLYTDGLVESPSLPLGEGLRRLQAAAVPELSIEALADVLLRETGGGAVVRDDIALVALRYSPARVSEAGPQNARRQFPPDPLSVSAGRRFVADVLTQWNTDDLCDSVTLLVSELLTNAVRYATRFVDLQIYLSPEHVLVEVADDSDRMPVHQAADDDAMSGRGLQIVEAVADAWGTAPRDVGKAVWFQLARV